jgi:sortase A
LRIGDPLTLTTADRRFQYRITSLTIVDPTEVSVLDPTGHPTMTLVTCYPFTFVGPAPRRFIVRADLVETESRRSTDQSSSGEGSPTVSGRGFTITSRQR